MPQARLNAIHGFHATTRARPGRADELIDLLLNGAPTSNENCLVYLVGRSAREPDVVDVTEGWTSKEAHAEAFASASAQALIAKLTPVEADTAQYRDVVPVGGSVRA